MKQRSNNKTSPGRKKQIMKFGELIKKYLINFIMKIPTVNGPKTMNVIKVEAIILLLFNDIALKSTSH
jgi:uncharacterized protein Veg